jgi:hypothetical protein
MMVMITEVREGVRERVRERENVVVVRSCVFVCVCVHSHAFVCNFTPPPTNTREFNPKNQVRYIIFQKSELEING